MREKQQNNQRMLRNGKFSLIAFSTFWTTIYRYYIRQGKACASHVTLLPTFCWLDLAHANQVFLYYNQLDCNGLGLTAHGQFFCLNHSSGWIFQVKLLYVNVLTTHYSQSSVVRVQILLVSIIKEPETLYEGVLMGNSRCMQMPLFPWYTDV